MRGHETVFSRHWRVIPVISGWILLSLAGTGIWGCQASSGDGLSSVTEARSQASNHYHSLEKPVADILSTTLETNAALPPITPHPPQVLVLSGGVDGAPYASGVLVGWSKTGQRPTFDVVTGVSSGALIGLYAFLGPKYDADLQRLIETLKTADLVHVCPVSSLLLNGALSSTKPAEKLLRTEINDGMLADLRQAHAQGRRFFVGTMSLQTKRLVIWDIGALASSGRPDAGEMVRKVLLASFTYPGFAPPVRVNWEVKGQCCTEEHCDAGMVAMVFLRFGPVPGWPEPGAPVRPGWLAGSNLYVLACRKLYSDPEPVPERALCRGMTVVNAAVEALAQAQIDRLYSLCAVSGMRFHLLAMPQELPRKPVALRELFPTDAPELFAQGYEMGVSGPRWRLTPPGVEFGEESIPQSGLNLDGWR
jgi:Patatin-like phospholipase